ncbi:alpha/beta fold hydrolase [Hyphomonas johnsonii]|uniref:Alpha/beta fold family hydrolase n=1 Tax=Hyphomonas johnsonii MHS-2 TaxID=1280950 RepID=A0A059FQT1_9PROT|nr:alpha/beta hydrolase [Hyphomonas johnsonii]KCZ92891.1 alpha/beta fold family hydrolase [Hyphomonas johnsonii MHS-2]
MRRIRSELKAGGEIAGIEFGDPIKPYAAIWLHATGFNAMTYQSLLAPLGLRARVAALDMRGHGRSTLPARPGGLASWARFRDDIIEWLDKEAPQGVVLGGHSMGGCVALLVAGKRPDLVKGLVLADPVILSRRIYFWNHVLPLVSSLISRNHMAKRARKRKPVFKSFRDALESYTGRGAFSTWREPFLADYLLDGIERVDSGSADDAEQTWRLLCEPKWEAAVFAAQRNRPWGAMRKVKKKRIPISVLRPNSDSVISGKVRAKLIQLNPNMVMKQVRGTSHFLPMEAPYEVRDQLSAFIARLVEGFTVEEDGPVVRSLYARRRRVS